MVLTRYHISGPAALKIALVADLHEHDPQEVLSLLASEKPDVIALAGDLMERRSKEEYVDSNDKNPVSWLVCHLIYWVKELSGAHNRPEPGVCRENGYRFLREASQIAPVVYSRGNHELDLTEEDRTVIAECGVCLLEDEETELAGVRFGGLNSHRVNGERNLAFVERFAAEDGYKVLLSHHPEDFPLLSDFPIDLILSGHCHGGQIRLFGHGIFAPGQGFLPKYHHGIYKEGLCGDRMVVSAGCANTSHIPRWGNPPEVVILEVQ